MYKKQAALLRIVSNSPGISQAAACRAYVIESNGAGRHNLKSILAMLAPVAPSGKNRGRPAWLRREMINGGLVATVAGKAALAAHEMRAVQPNYPGSPEPMRFVDGLGAPATVGFRRWGRPPCSRNCEGGKSNDPISHAVNCPNSEPTPAIARDPEAPTPRRRSWEPPLKPRGQDLNLYNIRSALQDARRVHEQILDIRGGPAVMTDARFTHLIRALDLLVERLYGGANSD